MGWYMTFEIQTYTRCDGWVNTLTDSLDDTLVTFATYEAAQNELDDHLANLAHAVENGLMDDYSADDYRIVGVLA